MEEKTERLIYKVEKEKVRKLFLYSAKGLNNKEVAEKLHVHRVTVQRWASDLKDMPEEEFMRLVNSVLKTDNPVDRKMIQKLDELREAINALEEKVEKGREEQDKI